MKLRFQDRQMTRTKSIQRTLHRLRLIASDFYWGFSSPFTFLHLLQTSNSYGCTCHRQHRKAWEDLSMGVPLNPCLNVLHPSLQQSHSSQLLWTKQQTLGGQKPGEPVHSGHGHLLAFSLSLGLFVGVLAGHVRWFHVCPLSVLQRSIHCVTWGKCSHDQQGMVGLSLWCEKQVLFTRHWLK